PRYALHPLVRAFATSKLAEQPDFEAKARERWARWYCGLAAQVGFCWDDLGKLERLDPEPETIHAVLMWAFEHGGYADTVTLVEGVRYYYNVRGLWDDRLTINLMRAEAARQLGAASEEALALAHHIEVRSKQGQLAEAATHLARLDTLAAGEHFANDVAFE